jgi:hypothetical protein
MEGYNSRIGKDQMRQYMGSMYENSMVVYREYLQNACDAVEQALREGLIPNRRQANIAVSIDRYNKSITVEDVGIGIARENIGDYLVSVASSHKYKKGLVGKHGIGRLNGANYCDQIIYETSFAGEPIKSTLIWDVKKAREICADDSLDWDVTRIIDTVTHLKGAEAEDADKHYCKVTLVNVNDERLLDRDLVKQYVEQIVSVDYSTEFKDNVRNPAILKPENISYKQRFDDLWVYQVTVDDMPIQKTYASEFDDKVLGGMQLFVLRDEKTQEELAWGWFALNRRAEQFNGLPFSFIRARHHNFQIGREDLLNSYHKNSTAASYVVGELHITHPNIEPTGTRDGIEGGQDKDRLELALRKLFKKIYELYNNASKFKSNVVEKIGTLNTEIARQKITLKGESDPDERKKIKERIKEKEEAIKCALDALPKYQNFFEENDAWDVAQDVVDAVNEGVIKNYNTSAKVEKADAQIKELDLDNFKPSTPTQPIQPMQFGNSTPDNDNPGENPITVPGSSVTPTNPEPPTKPPVPSEMDAYKALSTVERGIVRKVLSVINSMTDIPDKQKQKLKNKLQKKIVKK